MSLTWCSDSPSTAAISNRFKITLQIAAKKLYMFHVLLIYSIHIAFLHITQTQSFFYWFWLFFFLFVKYMCSFDFFKYLFLFDFVHTTEKIVLITFLVSRSGVFKFKPYGANEIKTKIVVLYLYRFRSAPHLFGISIQNYRFGYTKSIIRST